MGRRASALLFRLIKKGGVYLDVFYTIFHDLMF